VAQSKNWPFFINTMIELKNITNKSNNNIIQKGIFQLTSMPVLLDIIVIFFRSIIVLSPNFIFLDCASIAISEWYRETYKRFTETYILLHVCILCQVSSCNQNHPAILKCNNLNMQIIEKKNFKWHLIVWLIRFGLWGYLHSGTCAI
jgi:hypothetical protein